MKKTSNKLNSSLLISIIDASKSLFQIATIFIIVTLFLRVYEYEVLKTHHELVDINLNSLLGALSIDLLLSIGFIGILLLPFIGLFKISKIVSKAIVIILLNIAIILSISLIQFYDLTLSLLDRVVFAYSLESMIELSNTTELTALTVLPYVISLVIFNGGLLFVKRIKFTRFFIITVSISAFTLGLFHNMIIPKEKDYKSRSEFLYSNNKLIYFIKDLVRYKPSEELNLANIGSSIKAYRKVFDNRQYLSLNYPFLRKPDQGDPLGPYFNKTKNGNNPNIVFILVESLCTPVSGPYSYKTSFTPFLDSLTEHSLYWRNNLSTAERTFAVLPAVLGSLPYSEKGFLDLNQDMPKHLSIINILANNNYKTRFFYGGSPHFNNMDVYLNLNNIDTIIRNFNANDSIPLNKNGFSWGFSDRAIFQSTFKEVPDTNQAYFSIYLTLSTHSPFIVKNQDYYMQRVIDRLKEVGIPDDKMDSYIKNQKRLSTFVFFDDELRKFFTEYRKRKDFENTIFVITGDHRGIIFDRASQIDLYHTPLIIYSPLLKKAHEFGGITTHADLCPTFVNFLGNQYGINTPKEVSWQGNLLDTSSSFHSQQRMAFMLNNRNIEDYIHGNYYLAKDNLFKIHDTMHLELIHNDTLKKQLKRELQDYKNLNLFSFMSLTETINSNIKEFKTLFFDFDKTFPSFFSSDTSSLEAYSGNYSIILHKDQKYGSIMPTIVLEENYERIIVTVEFMVLVSEEGRQSPLLVASISNSEENLVWEYLNIMNYIFGTEKVWKKASASQTLYLRNKNSKGSELKLYLWNNHGTELFYDNIKINIKTRVK